MENEKMQQIFSGIFNEIENMSQEDINRMDQNINDEVKNNQIEKFGVLYSNLKTKSQFH